MKSFPTTPARTTTVSDPQSPLEAAEAPCLELDVQTPIPSKGSSVSF